MLRTATDRDLCNGITTVRLSGTLARPSGRPPAA